MLPLDVHLCERHENLDDAARGYEGEQGKVGQGECAIEEDTGEAARSRW